MKKRPPKKNLVAVFLDLRKFVSNAEAVADEVSFETLTNVPYFELSLASIPFNKVESVPPIETSRGVD